MHQHQVVRVARARDHARDLRRIGLGRQDVADRRDDQRARTARARAASSSGSSSNSRMRRPNGKSSVITTSGRRCANRSSSDGAAAGAPAIVDRTAVHIDQCFEAAIGGARRRQLRAAGIAEFEIRPRPAHRRRRSTSWPASLRACASDARRGADARVPSRCWTWNEDARHSSHAAQRDVEPLDARRAAVIEREQMQA